MKKASQQAPICTFEINVSLEDSRSKLDHLQRTRQVSPGVLMLSLSVLQITVFFNHLMFINPAKGLGLWSGEIKQINKPTNKQKHRATS